MIILSGQDMAAMQSVLPQVAETASANAHLTVAGAMEDAHRTWDFLRRKFSTQRIAVSGGYKAHPGLLGTRWLERPDVTFVSEKRVSIGELQRLRAGEFYFLFESTLVKAHAFYTGEIWSDRIASNKFLLIRGPADRVPDVDRTRDVAFLTARSRLCNLLSQPEILAGKISVCRETPGDFLQLASCQVENEIAVLPDPAEDDQVLKAVLRGLLITLELEQELGHAHVEGSAPGNQAD